MSNIALQPPAPPEQPRKQTIATLEQIFAAIELLEARRRAQPKAVSLKEASRLLSISDPHITRKLIDQGALRARRAGRKILVSVQSINQWLGDKS
jgi:excisionase family DNA binding protein